MPTARIRGEIEQTISPWMIAAYWLGLVAAGIHTKWLSMGIATGASFCCTEAILVLFAYIGVRFSVGCGRKSKNNLTRTAPLHKIEPEVRNQNLIASSGRNLIAGPL
jgi:hypothetical protein